MKDVIRALKVERRLAARALKLIDSALAKVGGGVVRRRRRAKVARKAKAKTAPAPAKAPAKKKAAAPRPAQGESLQDRKDRKAAALAAREAEAS